VGKYGKMPNKRGVLYDGFLVSEHPSYPSWVRMFSRCYNKNDIGYPIYGGRGIGVCDEWKSFYNFSKDMGVRPIGNEIDRIDSNGWYTKSNCRWVAGHLQAINVRRRKDNKTGKTGVHSKRPGSFSVSIQSFGERVHIGTFSSFAEASAARTYWTSRFRLDEKVALVDLLKLRGRPRKSTTGVTGVQAYHNGKFRSHANVGGKTVHIGYFKTIEDAKNERDRFLKKTTCRA
jgi:hypothetical protein